MTDSTTPSTSPALAIVPSRRQFLGGALAASAAIGSGGALAASGGAVFVHGVASGDPLATAVVIWTRVSGQSRRTPVQWSVAVDAAMTQVVRKGTAFASAERDYTAKVDVTGLRPGETYWYQFTVGRTMSVVGRTKTLPVGDVSNVKLVVFSCSDFEDGYFNAYDDAAKLDDLNAVLHVGDYIYEYGRDTGGLSSPATQLGLAPQPRLAALEPVSEIIKLDMYRTRHALYKTDPSLQALHAKNAWITIWDDHESANDSWTGGAQNHQPATEGPWKPREAAAIQAYYEWMPIRDVPQQEDANGDPQGLYRVLDFGGLVRLIMLDTRLAGRDQQLDAVSLLQTYAGARKDTLDGTTATRARDILGAPERAFLENALTTSTQTWQLFGNQILAFYQVLPDVNGSAVLTGQQKAQLAYLFGLLFGAAFTAQLLALAQNGAPNVAFADSWTGYPSARAYFLTQLLTKARNPVVLSGDSHNAWTANLKLPVPGVGVVPVAAEFGGTSVTSGGLDQTLLGFPTDVYADLLVESSTNHSPTDKLIFTNQSQRGYLFVDVTPTQTRVDHVFLSTVFSPTYTTTRKSFTVAAGSRTAVAV